MLINNLNLELIKLKDPKVIEDDEYFFDILYDDKDFVLECEHHYSLKNKESLVVNSKQEANTFFKIYKKIIELFFDSHEEWFNDKLTYERIENMFNNYLVANIEENCLNLIISKSIDLSNNYLNSEIIPKIKISRLVFKNEKITVYLELLGINLANNTENEIKENIKNENETSNNVSESILTNDIALKDVNNEQPQMEEQNKKDDDPPDEKENGEEDEEEEEENEEEEEEEEEEEDESGEIEDEDLKEINIVNDNLESIDFNLTDEDYYIIYNILNNNIKDNLNNSVLKILKERDVNINKKDINELLNDSDDESSYSDDESEIYEEESDSENSIP